MEHEAVPVEALLDRRDVEPDRPQPLLVLRLAEDGHVARDEPLGRLVEVL